MSERAARLSSERYCERSTTTGEGSEENVAKEVNGARVETGRGVLVIEIEWVVSSGKRRGRAS